jgi:hypothetical protein
MHSRAPFISLQNGVANTTPGILAHEGGWPGAAKTTQLLVHQHLDSIIGVVLTYEVFGHRVRGTPERRRSAAFMLSLADPFPEGKREPGARVLRLARE